MRGFLLLVLAGSAHAQSVDVDGAPCADRIHVRAQGAPLAEVLKQLSSAAGFRLVAKTELQQTVSLDRTDSVEALLKDLGHGQNMIVQTLPNKACGGREAVSDVWFLPTGTAAPALAAAIQPRPDRQIRCFGPDLQSGDELGRPGHEPHGGHGRVRSHPGESDCTSQ